MVTSSGDIYFGGNNGFVVISHDIPIKREPEMSVSLHLIKVGDQIINAKTQDNVSSVTLPWNYPSMEIEAFAKDRNIFHHNQFQYKIWSKDKSTLLQSGDKISLQALSTGSYHIDASYLNNNGEWSSATNILEITITPPWWSSVAFKILLGSMIVAVILLLITLYYRNRGRKLAQLHYERSQELSDNKIKFLINISHELRTPLTLIHAPLKRLLESSNLEGDMKRTLVNIFGQSRYMNELINMVLDARRMESGCGEIEVTQHDANEWVSNIVAEFRDESVERGVALSTVLDPALTTLNFDGPKCRTVLSNLLMNALRYSRSDADSQVIVKSEKMNSVVRISIVDNGVGLVGVDIDSLFSRFVRLNNKSTGSGIGLSYSKAIIELHKGGSIGAYCNSSQGATFYFEIPLNLPCSKIKVEAKSQIDGVVESETFGSDSNHLDYSLSKHTILIVDDQQDMISFIGDALKPSFKKIYTASNGLQAYSKIKQYQPSIIVSDIMMPEMDGYELCYKVKNDIEVSHIPVILLSAKADAQSKSEGYKSGADVYVTKPFDLTYLQSVIVSQLNSRDISRRRYSQLNTSVTAEEITYSNADEQFMIRLNAFIADNLSNSIDVGMIATHMCMSRAALYKKLKTIIDIGAMEYVTKLRMNTAAERLRNTTTSITEIAMQCGYTDNQYFSKAFKQFHNVSPSQYRKG